MKLNKEFFNRDTLIVAEELLGKTLVRNINGTLIKSKIVEVEAYTGEGDKGCHTYGGKITPRTKTMYLEGGHIYIYLIYGLYHLMNFVTKDSNCGEAVLIRAIEPLDNLDLISKNRFNKDYKELSNYQKKSLTNGPGKLTKALLIDKSFNGKNLFSEEIYIEDSRLKDFEIIKTKRIGIDYAEEAVDFPYRFYIKNNPYVSVK